jgi:hypothetical protein
VIFAFNLLTLTDHDLRQLYVSTRVAAAHHPILDPLREACEFERERRDGTLTFVVSGVELHLGDRDGDPQVIREAREAIARAALGLRDSDRLPDAVRVFRNELPIAVDDDRRLERADTERPRPAQGRATEVDQTALADDVVDE